MVLKVTGRSLRAFAYGAITRSGGPFQYPSTSVQIVHFYEALGDLRRTLQPPSHNGPSLEHEMSLGCSPFARHYLGNIVCSSGY